MTLLRETTSWSESRPPPDTTQPFRAGSSTEVDVKLLWAGESITVVHVCGVHCAFLRSGRQNMHLCRLVRGGGFHVTLCCVVVWWGVVRMGPAYRTAATPKRDGGESCGRCRRNAATEIKPHKATAGRVRSTVAWPLQKPPACCVITSWRAL